MYCGNNLRNKKLLDGTYILGTRYECFRKGVGKGLSLPIDYDNDEYEPIDNEKIYCGKSEMLPEKYDRMGNLPACFTKGIGVGLKLARQQDIKNKIFSSLTKKTMPPKKKSRKTKSRSRSRSRSTRRTKSRSPGRRSTYGYNMFNKDCNKHFVSDVRNYAVLAGIPTRAPTKKQLCTALARHYA